MSAYSKAVRSFDHAHLAEHPAYAAVRRALSDLANQAGGPLERFLDDVRDMAATAPYADNCEKCEYGPDEPSDAFRLTAWPHAIDRDDGWLTCAYRCAKCGHRWTCGYAVGAAENRW